MKASELYAQLERDFITRAMSDDWTKEMAPVSEFVCRNFMDRSMGVVCDNATEVNKVYTAVFTSDVVMQRLLDEDETDAMLFVHHPMDWDIGNVAGVFPPMDTNLLRQFRQRRLAVYNLHVPLDNYGEFSTSANLAKALGVEITRPFFDYHGALAAIFGTTEFSAVQQLRTMVESVLGHGTSLYGYGTDEIAHGTVAVVAGGGNDLGVLEEMVAEGVGTLLTGITVRNEHSEDAHRYAESEGINILGGTHYSTEKFACQAMCRYFTELGLPSEFIGDTPGMEDL